MNENELRNLMFTAQLPDKGSFVIRYPRGRGVLVDRHNDFEEVKVGTGRRLKKGSGVAVLTFGPVGNNAAEAIASVEREHEDAHIAHYDMRFVKPLDEELLEEACQMCRHIITVEDGVREGGFGSAVLEWVEDHGHKNTVMRLGLPDSFVEHGTVGELQHIVGIDAEGIKKAIEDGIEN